MHAHPVLFDLVQAGPEHSAGPDRAREPWP